MAAPTPKGHKRKSDALPVPRSASGIVPPDHPTAKKYLSKVEKAVIQLYARGVKRRDVARILLGHIVPDRSLSPEDRMRLAVRRLKRMETTKWFRDTLWDYALLQADLEAPAIVRGVVGAARRGRVDAAKLALGLTGRYEERSDVQATQVTVVFGGDVPRPSNRSIESQSAAEDDDVVDGDWEDAS